MSDDDAMMPDPSLLLSEDRDKNVAEWLVGQIFGNASPTPAEPGGATLSDVSASPGEYDDIARGLFAHYFGTES